MTEEGDKKRYYVDDKEVSEEEYLIKAAVRRQANPVMTKAEVEKSWYDDRAKLYSRFFDNGVEYKIPKAYTANEVREIMGSPPLTQPIVQHSVSKHEPDPVRNELPAVWDLVIVDMRESGHRLGYRSYLVDIVLEDMKARDAFGREKHGGPALCSHIMDVTQSGMHIKKHLIWESICVKPYLRKKVICYMMPTIKFLM